MDSLAKCQLGPFTLSRQLGEGAFGQVWLGHARHSTNEKVAIKILRDELFSDSWALAAYERELRSTSKLYHENIGMLYDYGDLSSINASDELLTRFGSKAPFLIMEHIDGVTLRQRQHLLSWPEMTQVVIQLLNALAHAHARGVIHRDLKPSNVMVCESNSIDGLSLRCKLVDFGLAIHPYQPTASFEELIGTPPYMAPEQWEMDTRRQGPWTDLYALGCVIWTMVTGTPPFGRGEANLIRHRHLQQPPPPLEPKLSVPIGLESWLCMLLSKDLSYRYACAADALHDFIDIKNDIYQEPIQSKPVASIGNEPTLKLPTDNALRNIYRKRLQHSRRPFSHAPDLSNQVWHLPQPHHFGVNLIDVRGTPMIGRMPLKHALWSQFRSVSEKGTQAVRMFGDSGVGLSRIMEWFCETVEETGAGMVFSIGGGENDRDPLATVFQRQFRLQGLNVDDCLTQLHDRISKNYLLAERWQQAAKWLSNDSEDPFGTSQEKYQLAVDLMLAAASSQSKTLKRAVLALDNPNCTNAMRPFFKWLMGCPEKGSWPFFTLICSNDVASTTRDEMIHHHIRPLSDSDLREVIHRMMALSPDLSADLVEKTSGSPKIAREALRDLVRQQALIPGPNGYQLKPGSLVKIPSSLSKTWQLRLENFLKDRSDTVAHALELAATFGRLVRIEEYELATKRLGIVAGDALRDLFRYRLANLDDDVGAYRFRHPTLVQVLLDSAQEKGRTQRLNEVCATVLESIGDEHSKDRLGLHLIRSGQPEKGILNQMEFINRFGDTYTRMEINRRFEQLHQQLLNLNLPENHYLWQRYHYNDETRQYHQNNMEKVLEIQGWLDRNLSDPMLRGRFLQHRCYALSMSKGNTKTIPALVTEGLSIAKELNSDLLTEVFLRVQFDLTAQSQEDWVAILKRSDALLQKDKGLQPMAHWYWTRAWARYHHCNLDLENALKMNKRSLDIAKERLILTQACYAHQHLAELMTDMGHFEEACTQAEKAAQLAVKANPREIHVPRLLLGDLSFRMGRRSAGLEQMNIALSDALATKYLRFIRSAVIKIMRANVVIGDWDVVRNHLPLLTKRVAGKPWYEMNDFVDMEFLVVETLNAGRRDLGQDLFAVFQQGWEIESIRNRFSQIKDRFQLN